MKCGFALPYRPGMLVAGQSAGAAARQAPSVKIAQPAGFMVRLVAFIIDWMILGVIWLAVWFLWANTLAPTHFDPKAPTAQLLADRSQQVIYLFVALYLIRRLYFQGSWTMLGGSPGMRVLNVQIVDKEGQPVGFRRAWLRYLVLYGLLALPNLIISPFMVAFSERKTGLHDVIAGTYVIHFLDADRVQKQAAGCQRRLPRRGRRHRGDGRNRSGTATGGHPWRQPEPDPGRPRPRCCLPGGPGPRHRSPSCCSPSQRRLERRNRNGRRARRFGGAGRRRPVPRRHHRSSPGRPPRCRHRSSPSRPPRQLHRSHPWSLQRPQRPLRQARRRHRLRRRRHNQSPA